MFSEKSFSWAGNFQNHTAHFSQFIWIVLIVKRFVCGSFSIVGAVVVIGGLYLLLWGKEGDHQEAQIKTKEQSDPKISQGEP